MSLVGILGRSKHRMGQRSRAKEQVVLLGGDSRVLKGGEKAD